MSATKLPTGSFVRIAKGDLQQLIDVLQTAGYRVVGPRVADEAVVYDDLDRVDQLPIGIQDEQDGGHYRLQQTEHETYFDYVVGPHSLKNFLFPPRETILEGERQEGKWHFNAPAADATPLAVIGPRACDLKALAIQDRVFISDAYVDPSYQARRNALFVVAVNCRRAVSTCFCHAMQAGPAVRANYDLALTEVDDFFAVQVGTETGGQMIADTSWTPCSIDDIQRAQAVSQELETSLRQRPEGRQLETHDVRELLMNNLDHPRWQETAERCMACANCTMVCPTCFCSAVEEVSDLSGDHVRREREWASCFTAEHSYMHSGVVRKSTMSRYRQWLTHKLASWHDQFDTSGCTGCGRCITWCPVGIDLTEEVAAIRGASS